MSRKSGTNTEPPENVFKDICRSTRRRYSVEETIRSLLDALRGEEPIAALCRREGIAERLYFS